MLKLRFPWLFISSIFLLVSCEKEIELVPQSLEPALVVEATIEYNQAPVVVLTTSFSYFSTLTTEMLEDAFVRNAQVTVGDDSKTVALKEYETSNSVGKFYYYTIDSTNPAAMLVGKLDTRYKLSIAVNGKNYTATTHIPPLSKSIDSLWWEKAPDNPDTNRIVVFSRVFDPPGLGNYIRYFTRVNDSAFVPGFNSVFDDQVVDGTTYEIQVLKGESRNVEVDEESFGYFRRGDTVDVKLSNIDKETYDFWRTWEQNQSNINNPFGVPVKILSNLSEGAVGYFGGYASSVKRIVIPR
jgi:hypothetical protein